MPRLARFADHLVIIPPFPRCRRPVHLRPLTPALSQILSVPDRSCNRCSPPSSRRSRGTLVLCRSAPLPGAHSCRSAACLWAWQCGGGQKALRDLRKGTRLAEQSTSHQRVARPAGRAEHSTIRAALSDQHYQTSTIRAEHSRYRCWPSNDSTDSTGSRELLDRYRAGPIPSGPPTTVTCAGLAAAPPSTCARCSSPATGR